MPVSSESEIFLASDSAQIERCCDVMRELRPQVDAASFTERVLVQQKQGFQLAYVQSGGEIRSVAGFRITETLFAGRTLYVDDLVTRATDRSRGFGGQLFDWLINYAIAHGCKHLTLDSGVQRFAAHRFYLNQGMDITAHHFVLQLDAAKP